MHDQKIDVIATTISGSIADWGKVKRILPLFQTYGFSNVSLHEMTSHADARKKTVECLQQGTRIVISAGGSGTFNAVLEGCCDSGIGLDEIRLGFLRKGSADLIGKVLGMPDEIEEAIRVFAESINEGRTAPCDIILAESEQGETRPRHFVGYGGAEIFGEIPRITENKYIKYYKGVLGQLFGDLGPFFIGAILAALRRTFRMMTWGKRRWEITVDGKPAAEGKFQTMIIVNGDLGKDLPLARNVALGSGDFYLFTLRDLGLHRLPGQFKQTWNASVLNDPDRWGFQAFRITKKLELRPAEGAPFDVNTDGSTMVCRGSVAFSISGQIRLIVK